MSLTASMWTGVSGLLAHGDKMNIIGNNISNVNTVGFKAQRMDFADFMYQDSFSLSGMTQVGRGVQIGAVMGDFSQGSTEATTDNTDLAIGGRGFFKVKPQGSDIEYFTRAGNFRFNNEGYLCDPNGYVVQGWKVDNTAGPTRASNGLVSNTVGSSQILGSGVSRDVRLDTWTVDPLQTTKVSFQVNLSRDKGADKANDPTNPFASLFNVWDGKQPAKQNKPYISEDSFSYQTSIDVYDEAGGTHTLTVYFDKIAPDKYSGGSSSESMWEYIVTMDPSEDLRQVAIPDNTAPGGWRTVDMKDTASAGMLMSGTLTFDSQGKLSSQSAYVLNGTRAPISAGNPPVYQNGNGYVIDANNNPIPEYDPTNPAASMFPTEVSNSGFPMLVANFTGIPGAQTVGSVPDADKYLMEVDFGLKVSDYEDPWQNTNPLSSLKYLPINNPMINGGTGLNNPATPANQLPTPSRQLTLGDVVDNGDGTNPRYIYNNPDYDSTVASSPPYVYASQTQLNTAYARAVENARIRLKQPAGGTDPVPSKADWPATVSPTSAVTYTDTGGTSVTINTTAVPATAFQAAATPPNVKDVANIKPPAYRQPNAFTSYKGNNSTQSSSQNGYGFGNLMNYTVDGQGVLYGIYSNGVNLPLYQLTLYDFTNKQGLRREGGNLFSQTRDSGDPSSGAAGSSGFGTISANSLEGSNVDLSREFVQMITTQRGFQSNSKVITTTDTMLETVINMKR